MSGLKELVRQIIKNKKDSGKVMSGCLVQWNK